MNNCLVGPGQSRLICHLTTCSHLIITSNAKTTVTVEVTKARPLLNLIWIPSRIEILHLQIQPLSSIELLTTATSEFFYLYFTVHSLSYMSSESRFGWLANWIFILFKRFICKRSARCGKLENIWAFDHKSNLTAHAIQLCLCLNDMTDFNYRATLDNILKNVSLGIGPSTLRKSYTPHSHPASPLPTEILEESQDNYPFGTRLTGPSTRRWKSQNPQT